MFHGSQRPQQEPEGSVLAKILVVDDEKHVRRLLRNALEKSGHTVEEFDNGASACKRLTQVAYDVIVTDLQMEPVDGLEVLARATEEQPEAHVIVVSGLGSLEKAVEAMRRGAYDYIQKSKTASEQLQAIVNKALEHKKLKAIADSVSRNERSEPSTLDYDDPAMEQTAQALQRVSGTNATVLLLGESGTGKEVAARTLHRLSNRSHGPFVAINCAALSESLLESELFGHEKGAFTGASARQQGRIELAQGGTFFMDEVGEMKLDLQTKLLRVLETRSFERVGGRVTLDADVRWVAATNRDLSQMVKDGTFREDLYYRLNVFPIELPSLRQRPKDIPRLSNILLERIQCDLGRTNIRVSDAAHALLARHAWPGNIRELRNTLERAIIMAPGNTLEPEHFWLPGLEQASAAPSASAAPAPEAALQTLEQAERNAIARALEHSDGNRRKAAIILDIPERTLYNKIKKYGF